MTKPPFSDTTSPLAPRPSMVQQAAELIQRLDGAGASPADYRHFETIIFAALHTLLDRIEVLECERTQMLAHIHGLMVDRLVPTEPQPAADKPSEPANG